MIESISASVTCGANEMFSQCGDDGCQRTCSRRDTTGCVPVCRASGCICLPGYGRNTAGVCELISACRKYTIILL